MSLVPVKSIKTPKLVVTSPKWVKVAVGSVLVLLFIALFLIPLNSTPIKVGIAGLYVAVIFSVFKKVRDTIYAVTMQANRDGVYFKSDRAKYYYFVPWRCIGRIEKAAFPLNARALRLEITGEYRSGVQTNDSIGNVMSVEDRLFIYRNPQLNDRDKLIDKLLYLKRPLYQ
jgi:hypothetical protein